MVDVLHSNGARLFVILQLDPFERDVSALEEITNRVVVNSKISVAPIRGGA